MKDNDTISRQAAIDALKRAEALTRAFGYHHVIDTIRELPTAAPRTGKWVILDDKHYDVSKCSECGVVEYFNKGWKRFNFCPNCGARMEN